ADGALPVEDALALARAIADALDALHSVGMLHRDLKPEHLLVEAGEGDALHVSLVDAGLAPAVPWTAPYGVFGTPGYVSPEQIVGRQITARSDLYALGCITFEMLTGTPLFVRPSIESLLEAHATA